jgi:hypothetical protein
MKVSIPEVAGAVKVGDAAVASPKTTGSPADCVHKKLAIPVLSTDPALLSVAMPKVFTKAIVLLATAVGGSI